MAELHDRQCAVGLHIQRGDPPAVSRRVASVCLIGAVSLTPGNGLSALVQAAVLRRSTRPWAADRGRLPGRLLRRRGLRCLPVEPCHHVVYEGAVRRAHPSARLARRVGQNRFRQRPETSARRPATRWSDSGERLCGGTPSRPRSNALRLHCLFAYRRGADSSRPCHGLRGVVCSGVSGSRCRTLRLRRSCFQLQGHATSGHAAPRLLYARPLRWSLYQTEAWTGFARWSLQGLDSAVW